MRGRRYEGHRLAHGRIDNDESGSLALATEAYIFPELTDDVGRGNSDSRRVGTGRSCPHTCVETDKAIPLLEVQRGFSTASDI